MGTVLEPEELGQRRADLAGILRGLRKQAGLTGDRLAARCGISQSKISKIETGRVLPSVVDVERMLRALDAPEEVVEETAALARLANTEFEGLRDIVRRGLHKKQAELAALEATSTEFRYFLPVMITGLLATPEYARASLGRSTGDIARAVAGKLARQAALYDPAKRFTFVVTEAAARWPLCPPAEMAGQLDKLVSVSRIAGVRLGVIPAGQHYPEGPMNTFTIYDDRLATAETFNGVLVMRDPRDIAYHSKVFETFSTFAKWDDEARHLLESWANELRTQM